MRLYETFLKRSARQQKLGQFFTPRNIVRAMIHMAQLCRLPQGSVVLDPAAGVGGFILEPMLVRSGLPNNVRFERGEPRRNVLTVGVDVDANTHILAKANTLLHMAEALRDPATTLPALNQLMAQTFVLMNSHETLGALENPPREAADVILTNPPYVTQGSRIYKEEIAAISGTRNGVDLRDYYDRAGLGLEALFLRYIVGALKPGGRAFVIVPLGMLNRTEPGPKTHILEDCNLLASIRLPRSAFFNTAQKTYILVLEKRHTTVDARPPVLCALTRTIGETLDYLRVPTPGENDLRDVAEAFVSWRDGDSTAVDANPVMKLVPAEEFGADDRWDVTRFWNEDELVDLGEQEPAVDRIEFIAEARDQLEGVAAELEASERELHGLEEGIYQTVSLGDKALFRVRSGKRIRTIDILEHPGDLPVFSCFKDARLTKGSVDEDWLRETGKPIEERPIVTINANGASVGKVYVRNERCAITDDVIIVDILSPDVDPEYLAAQLRDEIEKRDFVYEAKLFQGRVRELDVCIPVCDGNFDLQQQHRWAAAIRRFSRAKESLYEAGLWSRATRTA